MFGLDAYFPTFNLAILMNGPSGWDNIEAVPNLTKRPDVDETGLAVLAVRGVERAVRKASGRPPAEEPGRDTPLMGLPIIIYEYYTRNEILFRFNYTHKFYDIDIPDCVVGLYA